MKIFLICVSVAAIIIYALLIKDFIVGLKQIHIQTRNYDMESVLDRWQNAEKQFQNDKDVNDEFN